MAWRRFSVAFLALVLVCGGATLVFGRLPAAARCRPSSVPDTFLAECRGIGDYEHAAFALGLEPAAVAALGRAQVVVLGNSRAQFAFSTEAAARRFAEAGIPFYRAGFGYAEGSAFALTALAHAGSRPRALIVNADPFFTDRLSQPATRLRDAPAQAYVAALRTKLALEIRAALCGRWESRLLCRGSRTALHRVRSDGAWAWQESLRPAGPATQIDAEPGAPIAEPGPGTAARALAFLAALGVEPGCLFLTAVPNSQDSADGAAARLAAEIGARLVLPRVAGLGTIDGSHLDGPSAERWSAAFLDAAEPGLRACLSVPAAARSGPEPAQTPSAAAERRSAPH
ncbi:hypothetical protein [Methylobacterium nigriterrae]|uniref:hypothetical protein n=1 Tax=Methylobacterium nigriterrae TaxID=3127512 RepID=UPI003013AAA3